MNAKQEVCLCDAGSPDGQCPIHGEIYVPRYSRFTVPNAEVPQELSETLDDVERMEGMYDDREREN